MWDSKKKGRNSKVNTLIGKETEIRGGIVFQGGLHIDGVVKGDVSDMEDQMAVLTVGEEATIEGDVHVPHLILDGSVVGDVHATETVELAPNACVTGNIYYNRIEMAMGAEVNGQLIHVNEMVEEERQPVVQSEANNT